MKKLYYSAIAAALSCALLSGCASGDLRTEQKAERQAMANKQEADRQLERAKETRGAAALALSAAQANLIAKEQKQKEADAALEQILNPAPEPAPAP